MTYTPLLPYTEDQLAEDIPKLGSGGRPNWAQLTRTEKQVSWELTTLVSIVDCRNAPYDNALGDGLAFCFILGSLISGKFHPVV